MKEPNVKSEKDFIKRIIKHNVGLSFFLEQINPFSLLSRLRIAINIPSDMLIKSWKGPPGDVDIIFEYSIEYFNKTKFLVGIEAKFLKFRGNLSEARILPLHETGLTQALGLKEMGFHFVWLVYFASKPPEKIEKFESWIKAADFWGDLLELSGPLDKRISGLKWRNGRKIIDRAKEEGIGILIIGWGEVGYERPGEEDKGSFSCRVLVKPNFNCCCPEMSEELSNNFDKIFKNGIDVSPILCNPPCVLLICKYCKRPVVTNFWEIPDKCPFCGKNLDC